MINSRKIEDLRPDVASNCLTFIDLCKRNGLDALITGTFRDREYQEYCYQQGTARTKVPSFHAAGLAFDICKNLKGQEYSDLSFFRDCAIIGREIGFEWGGDWGTFPDYPHFQWSENGKYNSKDIIAGRLPGTMPQWGDSMDVEKLTNEECYTILLKANEYAASLATPDWMRDELKEAIDIGITDGTAPIATCMRGQAAMMVLRAMKGAKE